MVYLTQSCKNWRTSKFEATFKHEVAQLGNTHLPLQQGLRSSSYALDDKLQVSVISISEIEKSIRVKAGFFYNGVIAGCNCADDPTPVEEVTEYCEVQIDIDKASAIATIKLLD